MIIDENPKIDNAQQQNSNHSQDSEVVLSVKGVSKKFCRDLKRSLFYGVQDIASDLTGLRTKSDKLRKKEFWALDNVSFELKRGEAFGLVGKNGSGKSTLLRIIAGLIKPDLGTVEITGRVAPLIALGAGFNPILTGRENIYANMAILGLSKQEIDERFDDVVEFAEIGDAIDAPVQTYSSGMAARLGFASAIHTEPDILLIDEVLAVGDIKFRGKCARKLNEIRDRGISFILVNHKPSSIVSICESGVYLDEGKIVSVGESSKVIKEYEEDLMLKGVESFPGKLIMPEKDEADSEGIDITYLCFKNEYGEIIDYPQTGEHMIFCVGCKAHREFDNVYLKLLVRDLSRENEILLDINGDYDGKLFTLRQGRAEIRLKMPFCGLKPSIYEIQVYLARKPIYRFDICPSFKFKVKESSEVNILISRNLYYQARQWQIEPGHEEVSLL